ncbi:hypothetical protein GCM10009546_22910 [Actinomadura livida]|uniref:Uncharacterized protein n=1 Tax=Actinomadura livida TaxID=79909 RepID=A0ABP3P979_9ACTN|nr:hypothetical protein GCM10010208_07540 [Actinomadura livida]
MPAGRVQEGGPRVSRTRRRPAGGPEGLAAPGRTPRGRPARRPGTVRALRAVHPGPLHTNRSVC